jgi:hypothetical protein
MADRYDVVSFKKTKTGKTFAIRLGSAVQSNNGDGWNLYLDAIPAPEEGQYRLSIVPPRERQSRRDDNDDAPPF